MIKRVFRAQTFSTLSDDVTKLQFVVHVLDVSWPRNFRFMPNHRMRRTFEIAGHLQKIWSGRLANFFMEAFDVAHECQSISHHRRIRGWQPLHAIE
ncbi:hypothetical protein D3C81_2089630 [compost metagenome]